MSPYPSTNHWHYLHGKPTGSAQFKSQPEDFRVSETLPFELTGEGEHLFLHIEKTGINTGFLAQQIAKIYKVKDRDVGYAGRKDKQAVTRQWFSVWLPGKSSSEQELPLFKYPGCRLLAAYWHNKKLRTGAVQNNHFAITLREVKHEGDLKQRIELIKAEGVPNYFGPQRFGNVNSEGIPGNLALAEYLLNGEIIRKREKRSLAISALRSWLFNECVSKRLQKWHTQPHKGDAMNLTGSNSFFLADDIGTDVMHRLQERDIAITTPLWGKGELATAHAVAEFEQNIAIQYQQICTTLENLDLRQERRKILLFPQDLTWQQNKRDLSLQFSLPAGCFATSVIRELLQIQEKTEPN